MENKKTMNCRQGTGHLEDTPCPYCGGRLSYDAVENLAWCEGCKKDYNELVKEATEIMSEPKSPYDQFEGKEEMERDRECKG